MRVVALLLTVLVGLAAAAILVLPRWIDTPAGREALLRALAGYAGAPVTVDGVVEFALLPRPRFTLARLGVGDPAGAAPAGLAGRIDRIDAELDPAALLRGRVVVSRLRIVRPDLELRGGRDRLPGLLAGTAGAPILAAELIGGRFRLSGMDGPDLSFEELDLLLSSSGPDASKRVEARARLRGTRIRLDLEAGPARPGRRTPVRMRLAIGAGGAAGELVYTGLASGPDSLSGEVEVRLADPRALDVLAELTALEPPRPADAVAPLLPLALRFGIDRDGTRTTLEDGRLAAAPGRLRFAGTLRAGEVPSFDLDLRADDWSLAAEPLVDFTVRALWRPPQVPLAGEIRLAAERLLLSGHRVDELRGRVRADGTGGLRLEDVEARLPAGGRLELDAALEPGAGTGSGRVRLSLILPTLHETLAAWRPTAEAIPPGVPRSLSAEVELRTAGNTLRLDRFELLADATRLSLEGVWRSAPLPRLDLTGRVTRPDLDPWLPLLRRHLAGPGLASRLAGIEATVGLVLDKPSLASVRAERAELDLVLQRGRLQLRRLHLADLAGADLAGTGSYDLTSGAWRLESRSAIPSPGRLLRLFGLPADPLVLALGPLEADLRLGRRGRLFDAALRIDSRHLSATASFRGSSPDAAGLVSADLELEVASLERLARAAGVPLLVPVGLETPVDVRLALTRTGPGVITTAGHGRVADREWALDGEWREPADRLPEWVARLRLSRLPPTPLLDVLYRLAAPAAGWPSVPPWHWAGAWPATPVTGLGTRRFAVELELLVEEEGGTLRLLSAPGQLTVEDLHWPLAEGRLAGRLELRRRDGLLEAVGRLDFEDVEVAALLDGEGGAAPLAGSLELDLDFRGRGRSPAELVAGLAGSGRLAVRRGALPDVTRPAAPLPAASPRQRLLFGSLGGELRLRRGTLVPLSGSLPVLTEPPLALELGVDLYAWMIEARLLGSDGRTGRTAPLARLFGPLVRPLWTRVPSRERPAAAPSVGGAEHLLGPH